MKYMKEKETVIYLYANDWNTLAGHIVNAESIGCFQKRLDECMDEDDRWVGYVLK